MKNIKKATMKLSWLFLYSDGQYFLKENLFYQIDEEILLKLLNMADFMKNLVYPGILGYNLFNIIKNIYEKNMHRLFFTVPVQTQPPSEYP